MANARRSSHKQRVWLVSVIVHATHARWQRTRARLGLGIFCVGFCVTAFSMMWFLVDGWRTPVQVAAQEHEVVKPRPVPVRILVENYLSVPIEQGTILNETWSVSESAASYLDLSALPGSGGNTVIYGHNSPEIFRPLYQVGVGQLISLVLANGEERVYQVFETKRVPKDAIEILSPTDRETLTVYTCIGWFDAERWVVIAHPVVTSE